MLPCASMGHALVVGGGVIGVCAAHSLLEAGWRVTLVDQADIAAGSSYGNAGLIVPSHSIPLAAPGVWIQGLRWMADPESPFYIKPRLDWQLCRWLWQFRQACRADHVERAVPVLRDLHRRSLGLYRELARIPGLDFDFRETGVLLVAHTDAAMAGIHHEAEILSRAGLPAAVLDGAGLRALEPALSAGIVGGAHFASDALLRPDAFVRGLAGHVLARGGEIRRDTEVLGFRTEGRRVVAAVTTRGRLDVDEVVLAAGAWSAGLATGLGLTLPLQPAKGYSVTYRVPGTAPGPRLRMPLLPAEAKFAITPMGDWLRLAGTLELAGFDLSIARRRVEAIVRGARPYLAPGVLGDHLELVEIWRGWRPVLPDGLPAIGRPARYDNLVMATGHAMIGMSLGPVTGQLVAELVAGKPVSADLGLLQPDRFA